MYAEISMSSLKQPEPRPGEPELPAGTILRPPVTRQLLEADTDYDPEGAERLVQLIEKLRQSHPVPIAGR